MMSPQQAFRLFVYADWAMLIVGLAAIVAAIGWATYAVLPRNRGQRRRVLLKALMSFLVFAMFWGTQASVTVAFFHEQWTPLFIVLFALPVVVMLVGLIASIAYAAGAILRRTGKERRQMLLRSLVGYLSSGWASHRIPQQCSCRSYPPRTTAAFQARLRGLATLLQASTWQGLTERHFIQWICEGR